ncbi:MAG: hypothetical protein GXY81_07175 [Candidatus Cloacimonetes bacterium]|nr:hypothetical protein [Candidatus Cloacimonadota bacterium]
MSPHHVFNFFVPSFGIGCIVNAFLKVKRDFFNRPAFSKNHPAENEGIFGKRELEKIQTSMPTKE